MREIGPLKLLALGGDEYSVKVFGTTATIIY